MKKTKVQQKENVIPLDVVVHIFTFLTDTHKHAISSSLVCKDWLEALQTDYQWKCLCLYRWTFCDLAEGQSWKSYYIANHKMAKRWQRGKPNTDFKLVTLRKSGGTKDTLHGYKVVMIKGSEVLVTYSHSEINIWKKDKLKAECILSQNQGPIQQAAPVPAPVPVPAPAPGAVLLAGSNETLVRMKHLVVSDTVQLIAVATSRPGEDQVRVQVVVLENDEKEFQKARLVSETIELGGHHPCSLELLEPLRKPNFATASFDLFLAADNTCSMYSFEFNGSRLAFKRLYQWTPPLAQKALCPFKTHSSKMVYCYSAFNSVIVTRNSLEMKDDDEEPGEVCITVKAEQLSTSNYPVVTETISNEATRKLLVQSSTTLYLQDLEKQQNNAFRNFATADKVLSFTDRRIVTRSNNGVITVYDARTEKQLWSKNLSQAKNVQDVIMDDLKLVIAADSSIFVLDARDGNLLYVLATGSALSGQQKMILHMDNARLYCSVNDIIRVWNFNA